MVPASPPTMETLKPKGTWGCCTSMGAVLPTMYSRLIVWLKLCADQNGAIGKKYMIDFQTRPLLKDEQIAEGDRKAKELLKEIRGRQNNGTEDSRPKLLNK